MKPIVLILVYLQFLKKNNILSKASLGRKPRRRNDYGSETIFPSHLSRRNHLKFFIRAYFRGQDFYHASDLRSVLVVLCVCGGRVCYSSGVTQGEGALVLMVFSTREGTFIVYLDKGRGHTQREEC